MTEAAAPDNVMPDELLSRYILQSNHIRKESNTIKPDAFMPHPYEDLSVTRHLVLTQEELWLIGDEVSQQTGKTLYGRAENIAQTFFAQKLKIASAPVPENPNHANIFGWPADKPSQKMIALEIAAASHFVVR